MNTQLNNENPCEDEYSSNPDQEDVRYIFDWDEFIYDQKLEITTENFEVNLSALRLNSDY